MKVKIDQAGRIVVPKPLRERLGFRADTQLEAIEQPDGVLLKRIEQRPSMAKVDGLWVHQGTAEPGANCERVHDDVREERIESMFQSVAKWIFSSTRQFSLLPPCRAIRTTRKPGLHSSGSPPGGTRDL
jgi:AbrB family looped-hinge helix DNA binding protein